MTFLDWFIRQGFRLFSATALVLYALQANAITTNAFLQMQLGNPSGATADTNNHTHFLILRNVQAMDFNDSIGQVNWASWDLTAEDANSAVGRSPVFFTDTNLPSSFVQLPGDPTNPFSGSGYDRGHMCPSADRTDSRADNDAVFLMSNIIPQAALQNENIWADFESYCRVLLRSNSIPTNELLIICGPSLFTTNKLYTNHVAIAGYTWKIAVVVPLGSGDATNRITPTTRVIAIKIPNTDAVGSDPWTNYITSASQIETDTGFTFFTALPSNLAMVLRSKVDAQSAPAPAIMSFSPSNGPPGTSVLIIGSNLNFTTNVTFNGASALFNINSASNLIATVPVGASSGPILVKTLGGSATNSGSFVVTNPPAADLSVTCTHIGSFTQGDPADTYTITITNGGSADTAGTVSVVDALPSGLTAAALSGTGWSTDLGTRTCTRSDTLAVGAVYPAITMTVSVSSNAPATVTNLVTVSGGGDLTPANNSATDITVIAAGVSGGSTGVVTLAGWDVSTLPGGANNFGASPLAPTTNAPNLSVVSLVRGMGVGTNGTGAQRAFGGNAYTNLTAAAAIGSNQFFTFGFQPANGYKVSFSSVSKFDYRRSATGPATGVLQYQLGSSAFTDITALSYPSSTNIGSSLNPIDLSNIPVLQNVGPGTNVTFRMVNYGGGSVGTWYIFDTATSSAPDFALQGTVSPLAPIEAWRFQYFSTTANTGTAADTYIASTDGMPNLLKYALGLNPLFATNNPVIGDIDTGFLRLTLPKNSNATDISFHVQVTSAIEGPWTNSGIVIDQNTATLLQVHDATPVPSVPERFIRLQVTRP